MRFACDGLRLRRPTEQHKGIRVTLCVMNGYVCSPGRACLIGSVTTGPADTVAWMGGSVVVYHAEARFKLAAEFEEGGQKKGSLFYSSG